MSEQHTTRIEKAGERHIDVREINKHSERLKVHHEKAAEQAGKNSPEQATARHEVKEQAISGAEYSKPQSETRQPLPIHTKKDKDHSFNTIMHHARSQMSKPEQTFSKIIHTPAIEKTSEVVGKTIARPSGIAGAAVAACVGLLSIYSIAKFAGFQLSGSEMPLLLASGFAIGLFSEWVIKSTRSLFSRTS
jgi:hypothetical protein